MLWPLLLACAPSFDETRKDLAGFRLLAMTDAPGLAAAVWSGEGAWHSTAPVVTWTVDVEASTAAVKVQNAAGESERGELVRSDDAVVPRVSGFTREVDGSTVSLALEGVDDATTRWMATSGALTETGPAALDWTPTPDGPTGATIFALALDGRGGTTWTWLDVETGPATPTFAVDGRLVPMESTAAGSGWFLATLTPADTVAGYVLTDLAATADGTGGALVCGLDPFEFAALADGRCGRDDAAGARVALHGEALP